MNEYLRSLQLCEDQGILWKAKKPVRTRARDPCELYADQALSSIINGLSSVAME